MIVAACWWRSSAGGGVHEFVQSSTIASTVWVTGTGPRIWPGTALPGRHSSAPSAKRTRATESRPSSPQPASTGEQIKYEGSGRHFASQRRTRLFQRRWSGIHRGQNDQNCSRYLQLRRLLQFLEVLWLRQQTRGTQENFSSPRAMMFSSRVKARSSTAAIVVRISPTSVEPGCRRQRSHAEYPLDACKGYWH